VGFTARATVFHILEGVNKEWHPKEEQGQNKHAGNQQHQKTDPGKEANHKIQLGFAMELEKWQCFKE
jgi:hypothetical protein